MSEIASAFKIAYHREKLESYLRGEPIFPATLELDITSECTRNCPDCPSSRGSGSQHLSMDFIERLFSVLEGQTRGLLLTGGEPTLAPTFPGVLRLARKYGFIDVAVVTNGSLLHQARVSEALLNGATTIRVSLYDWGENGCGDLEPTLKRIEMLRRRIDSEQSGLQIGVSLLTSKDRIVMLDRVADAVRAAGAHWIYFHPLCIGWNAGCPQQVDQEGVLPWMRAYRRLHENNIQVSFSSHRYMDDELTFEGYHAAHFLLIVGADGVNYFGAEVKYQPQHALWALPENFRPDFLWQRERLSRIQAVRSDTYPALGSRHRGVLYNDFIEKLKTRDGNSLTELLAVSGSAFRFPHIL